jgi:hypothetical protein
MKENNLNKQKYRWKTRIILFLWASFVIGSGSWAIQYLVKIMSTTICHHGIINTDPVK